MGQVASALIFDLDGTVWDSHPFYASAVAGSSATRLKRALADLKAAAPAATLLKNGGVTESAFRSLCTDGRKLALYPGALSTITGLYERETPLGAVTNLPAWMVTPMLACHGIDDMLGSIVTYRRHVRRKPWPDQLLLCCSELDVLADAACFYVGDSDGDCEAAHRAGLSFAWASWGYDDQAPTGSDVTLKRFSEVATL